MVIHQQFAIYYFQTLSPSIPPQYQQAPPLIRDTIGDQLELIIHSRTLAIRAPRNQCAHVIRRLSLALLQHKPIPKVLDGLRFEARQSTV